MPVIVCHCATKGIPRVLLIIVYSVYRQANAKFLLFQVRRLHNIIYLYHNKADLTIRA